VITRIQIRRDLQSNWALANPIIPSGEIVISTDVSNFKIGDGISTWNSLDYWIPLDAESNANEYTDNAILGANEYTDNAILNLVDSAPEALNTLNELAAALGDDSNFATTVTNALSQKLNSSTAESTYQRIISTVEEKTTDYTISLTDASKIIEMNSSSATTVTIPANSSVNFPVGFSLDVVKTGTGELSFIADSGVTILSKSGAVTLTNQYSGVVIYQRSVDQWVIIGDLS
jgi:hypothetical protein